MDRVVKTRAFAFRFVALVFFGVEVALAGAAVVKLHATFELPSQLLGRGLHHATAELAEQTRLLIVIFAACFNQEVVAAPAVMP